MRVAGYCAYFVDLSPAQQAEIIARTQESVKLNDPLRISTNWTVSVVEVRIGFFGPLVAALDQGFGERLNNSFEVAYEHGSSPKRDHALCRCPS